MTQHKSKKHTKRRTQIQGHFYHIGIHLFHLCLLRAHIRGKESPLATSCTFALVAELWKAPAVADGSLASKKFWSDNEIVVDKDGVPHFTGVQPNLMKEYRRRVLFALGSLEGDGDTEAAEKKDLEHKQKRFALKLVNGLHDEAWRAVEHLVMEPERLKKVDGYKEILSALQSIEKESIIKKVF